MATLIPGIINAKSESKMEILTVEKHLVGKEDNYLGKICDQWNLTPQNVRHFFRTARPFIFDGELNSFDIYPCDITGLLKIDGKEKKYRINLGGTAFISDSDTQQGFGCKTGECLKYVHYEEYAEE